MGYEIVHFSVHGRLERHNAPGDRADNEAWERLKAEVRALIQSDPDYRRVTGCDGEHDREVRVG